jgi:hypothetical protein
MSWYLLNQIDQNIKVGSIYKSIYETAVMRALADHADDDGDSCYPTLQTLAQRSQCSRSMLKKVLKEFRKRGWITIEPGGGRCSNRYQILAHGLVIPIAEFEGRGSQHDPVTTEPGHRMTGRGSQHDPDSHHRLSSEKKEKLYAAAEAPAQNRVFFKEEEEQRQRAKQRSASHHESKSFVTLREKEEGNKGKRLEGNGAKIRNFWDVCGGRVCGLPVPIRGGLAD